MCRLILVFSLALFSLAAFAQGDITYDDGIGFFVEGGEKQHRLTRPKQSEVQRPFLGLSVTPLDAAEKKGAIQQEGVRVSRVVRGSSADLAGIHADDILLAINGTGIAYPEDLVEMIQLYEPGQMVAVDLLRAGARQSVDVTLGSRPQQKEKKWALIWDENRAYVGIDSDSLQPQLAAFFQVPHGVLVHAVHQNSAAEKAGLRAGDVLLSWNELSLQSKASYMQKLRSVAPGEVVQLEISRAGERQQITLTLGSRKGYFFNEEAQQQMYANQEYIVLPEALPTATSSILKELGNQQETADLQAEITELRREKENLEQVVAKLQRALVKIQANLDIKK